jgi:hypothetical protein
VSKKAVVWSAAGVFVALGVIGALVDEETTKVTPVKARTPITSALPGPPSPSWTPSPTRTTTPTSPTAKPSAPPAPPAKVRLPAHRRISDRQWKLISRDPNGHSGERIIIHCVITQADDITGFSMVRADCSGKSRTPEFGGVNTILTSLSFKLTDVAQDDLVTVKGTVAGALEYETQIGGMTTATEVEVNSIKRTGTL